MVRVTMFAANDGDALLVEYGAKARRLLIDGGRSYSARRVRAALEQIGPEVVLELLVLTHIDSDHIGGLLALTEKAPDLLRPRDLWFNLWNDALSDSTLGVVEATRFKERIEALGFARNEAFGGRAIVVPESGPLQEVALEDGATLTLLSPDTESFGRLARSWAKAVADVDHDEDEDEPVPERPDLLGGKGMLPPSPLDVAAVEQLAAMPEEEDDTIPNGSSIAFVFQHGKKRVLFTGDAYPTVLVASSYRLGADPYPVDIFKVSHHGARGNTSKALLERFPANRYLVSSNGAHHGHPHPSTIARIVTRSSVGVKTLVFNYETAWTKPWADPALQRHFRYEVEFGSANATGITVDI